MLCYTRADLLAPADSTLPPARHQSERISITLWRTRVELGHALAGARANGPRSAGSRPSETTSSTWPVPGTTAETE